MNKQKKLVFGLLIVILLIILPLLLIKGAEFGGSDDEGSRVISEINGGEYKPWATPILENIISGELPKEFESLMFCVQTGIGVGIIAFIMGRYVERYKSENKNLELKG